MPSDTTPYPSIAHRSQLNIFVKPKLFSTTSTGIEVHSADGKLLQTIPFASIRKLWEYNGLSAQTPEGDSFRVRYSRIYSSNESPVYISNTADQGASGQKYVPGASCQNKTFDQLMDEIKRQVAVANPAARIATGWLTVVLVSSVNFLIGAAMTTFPFFEFRMGQRNTLNDWMSYLGVSLFFLMSGVMLIAFGVGMIREYWPASRPIGSDASQRANSVAPQS